MSSLGVVSDFVVSLVSNPVWHGAILLDLFCQSNLLIKGLDGTLNKSDDHTKHSLPFVLLCYLINNEDLFPRY